MTRTTDFGGYIWSLCLNIEDIQTTPDGTITLACDREAIVLDLDMVTALGIVVTALVTNSYDRAFPGGRGAIIVSAHCSNSDGDHDDRRRSAQAESKRHGLGLVRRLIEQIRGTVEVKSDQGTVWTITFPVELAVASLAVV
ncbi:MAG TPA: sensor histidine kinase [Aliidongia sp.]|nr:sensor histidine kinase [Aliidongia sp.]